MLRTKLKNQVLKKELKRQEVNTVREEICVCLGKKSSAKLLQKLQIARHS